MDSGKIDRGESKMNSVTVAFDASFAGVSCRYVEYALPFFYNIFLRRL